jgi:2-amino-4-hydroxy-6-hydroxymethyldihydropteridine diphosphokinase
LEALFVAASLRLKPNTVWISLGANIPGTWGEPAVSLRQAITKLASAGFHIFACSPLYRTRPLGLGRQPNYVNMVIGIRGSIGPTMLLRLLKRLERQAGRRKRSPWQPRPLDLDILDFGGRIIGRRGRKRPEGRLQLPHPELHRRGFVLVPLAAVAPHWRHPLLDMGAREMLARAPGLAQDVKRLPEFRQGPGDAFCQAGRKNTVRRPRGRSVQCRPPTAAIRCP